MIPFLTVHGRRQGILTLRLHHNPLDAVYPGPDSVLLPVLPGGVQEAVGREEQEDTLGDNLEEHDDNLSEGGQVLRVVPRVVRGVELCAIRPSAQDSAPHLAILDLKNKLTNKTKRLRLSNVV